jgi:hypothetical protein
MTSSTSSTATPPKIDDQEFSLDLGSDFGKMFTGFDKRASVATVRDDQKRASLGPRSLTAGRLNQPTPIRVDRTSKIESAPYSWSSQHSNENLLPSSNSNNGSPSTDLPPPVPRHGSPLAFKSGRPADIMEDEDAKLLKESLAASKFLGAPPPTTRYRRHEDTLSSSNWKNDRKGDDDNLFDSSLTSASKIASRYVSRPVSPPRNKVMTPAQFEQYRQDKERRAISPVDSVKETNQLSADDDEDNYEDDEDDIEKSRQAAKQRRKQEAHMAVYRQQMMKVTGESAGFTPSRPSLQLSMTTPNLVVPPGPQTGISDGSDEDEEVPLAILAAHGFPSKNRAPSRLSTMNSNPNLRASMMAPPQPQRPGSSMGEASSGGNGNNRASHLPAFARNLPQDPFLGAGLVNAPVRESLTFGGGSPAANPQLPPGGLIGVIANEERSRAMRRGSPQIENQNYMPGGANNFPASQFDPVGGIPAHMMYNQAPQMPPMMLTPGDQAQIQMTQQMQQFMQMQMQFMQMMATQNGGAPAAMPRPMGHMAAQSMDNLTMRHSFVGTESGMMDVPPRLESHMRTMSMVQPSSASWIQPAGYAPSIRNSTMGGMGGMGGMGYAPSIAPSERSNVGLPGRYRPVSHIAPPKEHVRKVSAMSQMSGAMAWDEPAKVVKGNKTAPKSGSNSDDDDEQGWEAMKAKREKKRSLWKTKKSLGSELTAMIT